jgi:hypothetical protein
MNIAARLQTLASPASKGATIVTAFEGSFWRVIRIRRGYVVVFDTAIFVFDAVNIHVPFLRGM